MLLQYWYWLMCCCIRSYWPNTGWFCVAIDWCTAVSGRTDLTLDDSVLLLIDVLLYQVVLTQHWMILLWRRRQSHHQTIMFLSRSLSCHLMAGHLSCRRYGICWPRCRSSMQGTLLLSSQRMCRLVFSSCAFCSLLWHCWLDMRCWYHVYKTKDNQTTGFPVVLWHYRLSGRKDIQLIKIQWLFQ